MFAVESNKQALQREFERIRRRAPKEIEQGMREISQDALSQIRGVTPVDTGRLMRSLEIDPIRDGITVGSPLDYAEAVLGRPIERVLPTIANTVDRELTRMGDRILAG